MSLTIYGIAASRAVRPLWTATELGLDFQPFRVIEQHLARQQAAGMAHLAAARFTVADLCVASVLNWARPATALMQAHPLTHAWLARCMGRPAYLKVRETG